MKYLSKLKQIKGHPDELSKLPKGGEPHIDELPKLPKVPFDSKGSTRGSLISENHPPTHRPKRHPKKPPLITPAMVEAWRTGRAWILAHLPELEAAGWTRRQLFQAGRLKYPCGEWGATWFWPEGDFTVSLEPDGAIKWTWVDVNGKTTTQGMRPKTPIERKDHEKDRC